MSYALFTHVVSHPRLHDFLYARQTSAVCNKFLYSNSRDVSTNIKYNFKTIRLTFSLAAHVFLLKQNLNPNYYENWVELFSHCCKTYSQPIRNYRRDVFSIKGIVFQRVQSHLIPREGFTHRHIGLNGVHTCATIFGE